MDDRKPEDLKKDVGRAEELLHKESYSPQEAAEVLQMRERTILSAAYGGELKARIVNHDVVSIDRADLIAWLRSR